MATEATVTIKISPTEFDLLRDALKFAMANAMAANKNLDNDAQTRAANRERAGEYSDLIRRLA